MFWRSFFYIRAAASVLGFAFTFLTFIQVTYSNLSFFGDWFGSFFYFALSVSFFFAAALALFGHWWLKRGLGYKQEIEVGVEANPYQSMKVTPNAIPFWEGQVELMEKFGVDCSKIKSILKLSGSKKYELEPDFKP